MSDLGNTGADLSSAEGTTVAHVPGAVEDDHDHSLGDFGDYEKIVPVGRGGMGVVYRAWNRRLKRAEALKLIRAGHFAGPQELARFQLEAEAGAALDHPNIVSVCGAGEVAGQPYLAMRWVECGSLSSHLSRFRASPRDAVLLLTKVARAVHYAHRRGILHRDIKPANILLDPAGEPLITDFGLAKRLDTDAGLTETGAVAGTPPYMAPEQARGEKNLTVALDVYAIGAVLYALLTGRPPFTGPSSMEVFQQVILSPPTALRALNPAVDADLEAVCLKCLEKDPSDRYPSAEALADELDRYVRGEGVTARPPGIVDWLRQTMRTQPQRSADHDWYGLLWMGIMRLVAHAAVFGFALAGWSVLWVWLALSLHWAGVAEHMRYLAMQFRRLPATRRHSTMISTGHLLATLCVAFAYVPCSSAASANQSLGMYPALGALHGIVFFILGSTHWSRFYFLGLGALALVPVMAWWPTASPLLHGISYAACMWYWDYSLRVTFGQRASSP